MSSNDSGQCIRITCSFSYGCRSLCLLVTRGFSYQKGIDEVVRSHKDCLNHQNFFLARVAPFTDHTSNYLTKVQLDNFQSLENWKFFRFFYEAAGFERNHLNIFNILELHETGVITEKQAGTCTSSLVLSCLVHEYFPNILSIIVLYIHITL